MPLPTKMGIDLTEAEALDFDKNINNAIDILVGKMPINLTDEERRAARSVAEGRKPYADKTFDVLAQNNPELHPGYLNFTEDQTNYNYGRKLRQRFPQLYKLLEIVEDHAFSAENLAFRWMLKFYGNAQEARDTNTPGAESVVAALSPLFEQTNTAVPKPATNATNNSDTDTETTTPGA